MNYNSAIGAIGALYVSGRTKHPPFENPAHALQILDQYRDLFRNTAESLKDSERDHKMQRRLAQIGGIALKALVDITPDFPEPDPCQCPEPSKSKS